MRHLIDFGDLSREEWDTLYQRADQIISAPENFIDVCRGKVSCNLFYEPSTAPTSPSKPPCSGWGALCSALPIPNPPPWPRAKR